MYVLKLRNELIWCNQLVTPIEVCVLKLRNELIWCNHLVTLIDVYVLHLRNELIRCNHVLTRSEVYVYHGKILCICAVGHTHCALFPRYKTAVHEDQNIWCNRNRS